MLPRNIRYRTHGLRVVALSCLLATLLSLPGCRYPRDPNQTLSHIQGGVMHVGVIENRPWVIKGPSGAQGLEPELVRALADSLDADIRWHWGGESELITALEKFEIDLVIGGLVKGAPLHPVVGFTKPYLTTEFGVGIPRGQTLPAQLEGQTVAVKRAASMYSALEEKGAKPVYEETLTQVDGLVAAPRWWLQAHDFEIGDWSLHQYQHVMAVPPGENAWLLRLQRYLNEQAGLRERLSRLEAGK